MGFEGHSGISRARGGHVIVIGASTTGLIAAAALARHFSRVTVLERDVLPEQPEWRKGVPQSRHVHLLLSRGESVVDHYFPGLAGDLARSGGQRIDMAGDTKWYYAGGWKTRFKSGVAMHCQSKGFLEWSLRQNVVALGNVEVIDRAEVTEFLCDEGRITGARLREGGDLTADLIVDAGGRNSRTPMRLAELGFGDVELSELPVDVGYATRMFKAPPGPRDWKSIIVHPRYPDARLGILIPIEGERWLLTLVGWRGDHPPADEAGYLAFARSLAVPDIYDAVVDAEPLNSIGLHRFPGNLRRHYERLATMPEGLVVIGDASCSFNPIYGQGMSHGAMAASILDECLTARAKDGPGLEGAAAHFQKQYAKFTDACWFISTTEEYRDPTVSKKRPIWAGLANWYLDQIHELTWHDPKAGMRFLEVMHLLRPPRVLLEPGLATRAIAHGLLAR